MTDYIRFPENIWANHLTELRALDDHLEAADANKNDRVMLLIEECIRLGINKSDSIVAAIGALGHNHKHVGSMLAELRCDNPARCRWRRDSAQIYHLLQ